MIEQIGQFINTNFFVISLLLIATFTIIGYRADKVMRENATADRQSAEVDNYNPEEEIGI